MGFVLRLRGRGTFLLAAWLTTAAFSPLAGRVVRAQAVDGAANKASPHSNDYEELWGRLDEIIRYEVREKQLPAFSIAVVTDKRTLWSAGYGVENRQEKKPADAQTVYRVGSISKLLTDIAVMQQVERGRLDLDQPIQQYLPSFAPSNPFDVPITLRQLMSHRSGLVREPPVGHYFDPAEPTLADTVDSLNGTRLVYRPETRTKYSNAAIAVVGRVLEESVRAPFSDHVKESVLIPLGMRDSGFKPTAAMRDRLADAEMWTYNGRRFDAPEFLLGTSSAGNLYSTVDDLAKLVRCVLNDGRIGDSQLIEPETLQAMITPAEDADGKPLGFGIGFQVGDLQGQRKVGHGGAVYGFSTQLEALPESDLGVVAVSALDGSNGVVRRICEYVLTSMLAIEADDPLAEYRRTEPVPPRRAASLVGTYRDGDAEVRVVSLNEELYLWRGSYRYRLRAASDDGTILTDDPLGFGTEVRLGSDGRLVIGDRHYSRVSDSMPPAPPPDRWRGLIGEYGWDHNVLFIYEDHGQLHALIEWFYSYPLTELETDRFAFPNYGLYHGEELKFERREGVATRVVAAEVDFLRRPSAELGETFKIEPLKPIAQLRRDALAAKPPREDRPRQPDLVDVTTLDDTIKLDIRYASDNNFMGNVFYERPRAFLQRPAAEALVRVHQALRSEGLGLLIHDAYRPWFVTKMFWDATPVELKDFVANPANGSRHNRGCAVDLTLYDLNSGEPIEMVAGYDEFSTRAYPEYPGGTSRQRWYRTRLRRAMQGQGFTVYEFEWWHFDYRDWQQYPIQNLTFDAIENSE